MDVNRRIDAMVAERVMGWTRKTNGYAIGGYSFKPEPEDADDEWYNELDGNWYDSKGERVAEVEDGLSPEDGQDGFYPSQRISSAWEVVEKMRADDWLVTVKCNTDAAQFIIEGSRSEYDAPSPDRSVGPKWSCVCELTCMRSCRDKDATWRRSEFAIQPTATLAICLAALRAVGVSEPEILAAKESE